MLSGIPQPNRDAYNRLKDDADWKRFIDAINFVSMDESYDDASLKKAIQQSEARTQSAEDRLLAKGFTENEIESALFYHDQLILNLDKLSTDGNG